MNRLLAILGCLLLFLPASIAMCDDSGPYVSGFGGLVLLDESNNEDSSGSYIFSYEPGLAVGAAIGYRLGEWFPQIGKGRMEVELSYRKNDLDEVQFSTGNFTADGDVSSISVLVNSIAEYEKHPRFTPYIGVGLGASGVFLNDTRVDGDKIADDNDIVFAYQFMLGTTFPAGDKFVMDLGYRLLGTADPEFIDNRNQLFTSEYVSHTFGLGLRVDY